MGLSDLGQIFGREEGVIFKNHDRRMQVNRRFISAGRTGLVERWG